MLSKHTSAGQNYTLLKENRIFTNVLTSKRGGGRRRKEEGGVQGGKEGGREGVLLKATEGGLIHGLRAGFMKRG